MPDLRTWIAPPLPPMPIALSMRQTWNIPRRIQRPERSDANAQSNFRLLNPIVANLVGMRHTWSIPQRQQWQRDWAQNDIPLLTAPTQAPFNQTDWPLPRRAAPPVQTYTTSYLLGLIGQDRLPAGEQVYDRPRAPPILIPSWALGLNETTLGPITVPPGKNIFDLPPRNPFVFRGDQILNTTPLKLAVIPPGENVFDLTPRGAFVFRGDQIVNLALPLSVSAPPGESLYDLAPRATQQPLRSWTASYILSLIGQDQLPAGEQTFALPAPTMWYRDWSLNLINNTLSTPTIPPPCEAFTDLPPRALRFGLLTWASGPIGQAPAVPFNQTDWPVPRSPPIAVLTWTLGLNETTLPVLGPIQPSWWDVPPSFVGRSIDFVPTASLALQTPTAVLPFAQTDWPIPRAASRKDQTWTDTYFSGLIGQDKFPPGDQNFVLPAPPVRAALSWTNPLQPWLTVTPRLPGAMFSELPPRPRPAALGWTASYTLGLIGQDQLPPGENVYDRPPPVNWFRDWAINLLEGTLAPPSVALPVGAAIFTLAPSGPAQPSRYWQNYIVEGVAPVSFPPGDQTFALPVLATRSAVTWLNPFQPWLTVTQLPPGENVYDLPPPPRRTALTWTASYFLGLIGQDQLPVGNQSSALPPQPRPAALTWTFASQLGLSIVQLPPGENIYDLPPPPRRSALGWATSYTLGLIGQDQLPVGNQSYALPTPPPRSASTWLFPFQPWLVPPPPPGEQTYDLAPRGALQQTRTWLASYTLSLVEQDQLPVGDQNYALPAPATRPGVTWTNPFQPWLTVVQLPPGENVYDLPPPLRRAAVTWTASYFSGLIGQDQLPVGDQSYTLPPPPRVAPPTWTWNYQFWLSVIPVPPGAQFFERPPPPRVAPPTWTASYTLGLIGQDRFPTGQQTFELPKRFAPPVQSWAYPSQIALFIGPQIPPGHQTFDLAPRGPPRPDLTYTFTLNRAIIAKPIGQAIYELPRAPPRLEQTWRAAYFRGLIGQDKLPFRQLDWPLPRAPNYPRIRPFEFVPFPRTLGLIMPFVQRSYELTPRPYPYPVWLRSHHEGVSPLYLLRGPAVLADSLSLHVQVSEYRMAIYQDTYYSQGFQLLAGGQPVNLMGAAFTAYFRRAISDPDPPLLMLTTGGGGLSYDVTGGTNGRLIVTLTKTQTQSLPLGFVYTDFMRTDLAPASPQRYYGARFTVKQPVTRL
jgi:hypothetical protein